MKTKTFEPLIGTSFKKAVRQARWKALFSRCTILMDFMDLEVRVTSRTSIKLIQEEYLFFSKFHTGYSRINSIGPCERQFPYFRLGQLSIMIIMWASAFFATFTCMIEDYFVMWLFIIIDILSILAIIFVSRKT